MTAAAERRLQGIRAKLARALEHLLIADDQLHEYLDKDPFHLLRYDDETTRTMVYVFRVDPQPPIELAVTIGDALHQMRSAVDHIAYGLVLAAGNEPTYKTTFPVLLAEPVGSKPPVVHGGITHAALAAVSAVQPYQAGSGAEGHPLHVLHRLANIDKHRTLHLTGTQVADSTIYLQSEAHGTLLGGQLAKNLRDGDVVGSFQLTEELPADAEVIAQGGNFVAFEEPGPWPAGEPALQLLEQLHQYVTLDLLPRFEGHLLS
jgi:hypothetical protein